MRIYERNFSQEQRAKIRYLKEFTLHLYQRHPLMAQKKNSMKHWKTKKNIGIKHSINVAFLQQIPVFFYFFIFYQWYLSENFTYLPWLILIYERIKKWKKSHT